MGKIYSRDSIQARIDLIIINKGSSGPTFIETISSPKYRYATLIGCILSVSYQLTGINIVFFYSSTILSSTGLPGNYITALVGLIICLCAVPALYILKRFGRKPILWIFSFLMSASLFALGGTQISN